VLQLGAGSGYYTAILAELTGPNGRIDAVEIDQGLAQAARRNLEAWPAAWVRCADASTPIDGQWNVIVAFAGAAAPVAWWLDALADGGRLLLPMTTEQRGGFMLRLDRRGSELAARSTGWAGFYPCAGARSEEDQAALAEALNDGAGQQAVRSLRRDLHDRDETCWLHGNGWCLSKQELH
jgi:protein-L-isoaspartate(D-aspartate) O-methyltransferase